MGSATVKLLCERGFRVFAMDLAPRSEEKGEVISARAGECGGEIIPILADVTDEDSVRLAYERVKELSDGLFGIIHFAGIYMLDSLVEMSDAAWRKIFDVNVRGAFLVNKTFMPLLSEGSRILMTTSELAPLDPLPFTGIYAVTKTALDKYAYSLRMELQLLGITASVLRAGAVSTGMLGASTAALDKFCENTRLYTCNADRFKRIVERVEARSISPERLAEKAARIISRKKPRFAYAINRNPLLRLLGILPKGLRFRVIRLILK